jgi:hypothetical protein
VTGSVSYNDVDAPLAYIGQYNGPDGGAVLCLIAAACRRRTAG